MNFKVISTNNQRNKKKNNFRIKSKNNRKFRKKILKLRMLLKNLIMKKTMTKKLNKSNKY